MIARVVDYGGLFWGDVEAGHEFPEFDHRRFRPDGWVESGRERLERMLPIAERHALTPIQLASQWDLAHDAVACVAPTLIQERGDGARPIEDEARRARGAARATAHRRGRRRDPGDRRQLGLDDAQGRKPRQRWQRARRQLAAERRPGRGRPAVGRRPRARPAPHRRQRLSVPDRLAAWVADRSGRPRRRLLRRPRRLLVAVAPRTRGRDPQALGSDGDWTTAAVRARREFVRGGAERSAVLGVTEDRAVDQPLDRGAVVGVDLAAGEPRAESRGVDLRQLGEVAGRLVRAAPRQPRRRSRARRCRAAACWSARPGRAARSGRPPPSSARAPARGRRCPPGGRR